MSQCTIAHCLGATLQKENVGHVNSLCLAERAGTPSPHANSRVGFHPHEYPKIRDWGVARSSQARLELEGRHDWHQQQHWNVHYATVLSLSLSRSGGVWYVRQFGMLACSGRNAKCTHSVAQIPDSSATHSSLRLRHLMMGIPADRIISDLTPHTQEQESLCAAVRGGGAPTRQSSGAGWRRRGGGERGAGARQASRYRDVFQGASGNVGSCRHWDAQDAPPEPPEPREEAREAREARKRLLACPGRWKIAGISGIPLSNEEFHFRIGTPNSKSCSNPLTFSHHYRAMISMPGDDFDGIYRKLSIVLEACMRRVASELACMHARSPFHLAPLPSPAPSPFPRIPTAPSSGIGPRGRSAIASNAGVQARQSRAKHVHGSCHD